MLQMVRRTGVDAINARPARCEGCFYCSFYCAAHDWGTRDATAGVRCAKKPQHKGTIWYALVRVETAI
jgi:MinD superfamily P-loop ATPase